MVWPEISIPKTAALLNLRGGQTSGIAKGGSHAIIKDFPSNFHMNKQMKKKRALLPAVFVFAVFLWPLRGEEVQAHGVSFEKWVRDTFFNGYTGDYTQKWDIAAEANRSPLIPHQGLPVSVKIVNYGSPIGLGDVLRQRHINEPFLMIVGFWEQKTKTEKWIVEMECLRIEPGQWNALWGDLSPARLEEIDALVKDTSKPYHQVRAEAQAWKDKVLPGLNSRIVINPKIGSTTQRRVQCSLPFDLFWELAGREPKVSDHPKLFGKAFPNPISSSPRTFNAKE